MAVKSEDVARRAGVSRATVSQILNGRGDRFAPATRDKVAKAASDLNYEPSAAARTLATGSSDFVIALIPDTTFGGNLQDLFEPATKELASRGLSLVLRLSTDDPSSLSRMVSAMRPRAVISLSPLSHSDREALVTSGVPTFAPFEGDLMPFDNQFGALQAEHLVGRGHRHLAYAHLRDTRQDPFGAGREEGVRRVCSAQGLDAPATIYLGIDVAEATAALDTLSKPVGIACYNDDVAAALLAAAHARGLRIPEDVAIIGMDHTPLAGITIPPLSTVAYDLAAGGNALLTVLIAQLEGLSKEFPLDLSLHVIQGATT